MPSHLGRIRRRLDPGGKRSAAAQVEGSEGTPLRLAAPWGGYTPDISSAIASPTDAHALQAFLPIAGGMYPATGWSQLDSDSLPFTDSEPVVGVPFVYDTLTTPITLRRYAITADDTLGNLYELGANWTNIPYGGGTAGFSGNTTGDGVAQTLCDTAYYALANRLVMTNGFDVAYYHVPGAANYLDFSPAVLNPFKAKSVCSAFERVFFLNTSEAGTPFPNRLRGTTRSATPSLSGLGAVLISFDEIQADGVAVRKIGSSMAVYFRRGVAFCRETGNILVPVVRDYVSLDRGLVGTFAVCELGSGVHFGIFNDGWFLLDDNGRFTEVGLREINGTTHAKWRTTFYRELNSAAVNRVSVAFDRPRRLVWILWPDESSGHPNRLWVYHLDTDSVWPCDNIFSDYPNILGQSVSTTETTSYATITTTYEGESMTYADFDQKQGEELLVAGSRVGRVYIQNPRIYTVDGVEPEYQYKTPRTPLGNPSQLHTLERLDLVYVQQNGPTDVSISFETEHGTVTNVLAQVEDSVGSLGVGFVHDKSTAGTHALELSGTHPLAVTEMQLHVKTSGAKSRKLR